MKKKLHFNLDIHKNAKRKLVKNSQDYKICGVCGGFANYFNISSTFVRIVFLALLFFTKYGLPLYIIFAIAMPDDKSCFNNDDF